MCPLSIDHSGDSNPGNSEQRNKYWSERASQPENSAIFLNLECDPRWPPFPVSGLLAAVVYTPHAIARWWEPVLTWSAIRNVVQRLQQPDKRSRRGQLIFIIFWGGGGRRNIFDKFVQFGFVLREAIFSNCNHIFLKRKKYLVSKVQSTGKWEIKFCVKMWVFPSTLLYFLLFFLYRIKFFDCIIFTQENDKQKLLTGKLVQEWKMVLKKISSTSIPLPWSRPMTDCPDPRRLDCSWRIWCSPRR